MMAAYIGQCIGHYDDTNSGHNPAYWFTLNAEAGGALSCPYYKCSEHIVRKAKKGQPVKGKAYKIRVNQDDRKVTTFLGPALKRGRRTDTHPGDAELQQHAAHILQQAAKLEQYAAGILQHADELRLHAAYQLRLSQS